MTETEIRIDPNAYSGDKGNHPPGAVIIPCQETARYHAFTISLANLELPPGSQRIFGVGTSIVQNLNECIRALRPQDEWVWIVGDDHVFAPDTLIRLLDRGLHMVAPLCARRGPPFPLVHFGDRISETRISAERHVLQYDQVPDPDDGPFEVKATGSLPLISRQVLEDVKSRWFTDWFEQSPGRNDEEFRFCEKVRTAGYKIWVDPAVSVGHIGHIVTWPAHRSGEWGLTVEYSGTDPLREFYPGGMAGKVPA